MFLVSLLLPILGRYGAIWGVAKFRGTFLGVSFNKDYSSFGSILGSPYFGKLPYSEIHYKEQG